MSVKKTAKIMDPRKAQLVGLEVRDRAMKLAASIREEWPDIPDEEILVGFLYAAAHSLIASASARAGEAVTAAVQAERKTWEDEEDDDDEAEEA